MKQFRLTIFYCLLTICSLAQGANEIRSFTNCTAAFAVVREIDGDVWYVSGQVFEAWGTAARTAADYDIALTAETGGMFTGTFDTNIGVGYYYVITHDDADSTPADTDPAVWMEYGYWTGSAWQPNTLKTIEDKIDTIDTNVDDIETDTSAYDTDAEYATAIWNAMTSGYGGAGTYGQLLEDINDVNDAGIADAVWDELMAGHTTETTFGGELQTLDPNITLILADTNEIQTDQKDGGRLDLIWDAIKYKTDLITILDTTVKDANDANNFTLSDGIDVNDALWFHTIMVTDADDGHSELRFLEEWYHDGTDPNILVNDPFGFTPASGDVVHVMGTSYDGYLYEMLNWLKLANTPNYYIDATTTGSGASARQGVTHFDANAEDP